MIAIVHARSLSRRTQLARQGPETAASQGAPTSAKQSWVGGFLFRAHDSFSAATSMMINTGVQVSPTVLVLVSRCTIPRELREPMHR